MSSRTTVILTFCETGQCVGLTSLHRILAIKATNEVDLGASWRSATRLTRPETEREGSIP